MCLQLNTYRCIINYRKGRRPHVVKEWAKHMTITKYKLKKLLDKAKALQECFSILEDTIMTLNESVNELRKDLQEFEDKANEERNVAKW